jgi:hypothetical protein
MDDFDAYRLKVQHILPTTTAAEVDAWAARAQADRTWLILVYHEVTNPPGGGPYSTTPAALDSHLNVLARRGISVVTVQQALAEVLAQTGPMP